MSQFEIQAHSRHEFDRIVEFMRRQKIQIDDVYEPGLKVLAHLSKRERQDLEERGVDIRGGHHD